MADLEILKGGFVGTYTAHRRSAPPKRTAEGGAQSREVAISPREARKNFFTCSFSDQKALSIASLRILDMFPDAKKID